MADSDVHVAESGNDWVVTIVGLNGGKSTYEDRTDAMAGGRRVAQAAGSQLTLHFGETFIRSRPRDNRRVVDEAPL